jgi:hypothetical protein
MKPMQQVESVQPFQQQQQPVQPLQQPPQQVPSFQQQQPQQVPLSRQQPQQATSYQQPSQQVPPSQQQPSMGLQQTPRIQEPTLYGQNLSSQGGMQLNAMANVNTQQMLDRAGVSNFAQQVQRIDQQLQYVMERLHFAQNQAETQAQAQVREFRQMQQAIAVTVEQLRQTSLSSGLQPNGMP